MSTLKVNTLVEATSGGATYFTAKAWVNFKGNGAVAICNDGNFSSVSDNGTGNYTASYSNAFSNTNYGPVISCKELDSTAQTTVVPYIGANQTLANSITTRSIRICTKAGTYFYDSVVVTANITD